MLEAPTARLTGLPLLSGLGAGVLVLVVRFCLVLAAVAAFVVIPMAFAMIPLPIAATPRAASPAHTSQWTAAPGDGFRGKFAVSVVGESIRAPTD
jgi:hypothetical protein